jgi:hypothetical protein
MPHLGFARIAAGGDKCVKRDFVFSLHILIAAATGKNVENLTRPWTNSTKSRGRSSKSASKTRIGKLPE